MMQLSAKKRVITCFVLIFIASCSASLKNGSDLYKDPQMDFGSVKSVAVLPLNNLTRDASAGERVRDVLMNALIATGGVYVVPPGEIARGISRAGISTPTSMCTEDIQKFCGIIKADAVITGVLREYGEVRSGVASANAISLSLQMIEADTGKVVWSASSTKGGVSATDRLFGGGGRPMNDVTAKAISDLIDKLFR